MLGIGKKAEILKFCPNCGNALQGTNGKFCPECGYNLQSHLQSTSSPVQKQSILSLKAVDTHQAEEEIEPPKLNTYNLGVALENTTASIFEKMGYSVEKRQRRPMKGGGIAEIDILAKRGNRVRAIECKNYDPSKSVPVSDMHVFRSKLIETDIISGVFVTNTNFSEGAQKLGDSVGIELWDRDVFNEKVVAYLIGRISNPSLITDAVLPLNMDFTSASSLSIRNKQSVRLFSSILLYHPYFIVKYRLQAKRNDPTGKGHTFSDNNTYFVDALDGDIINAEKNIMENIFGLLKNKEERLQSKEEKMISEDLSTIEAISKTVLSNADYQVRVSEPEIKEAEILKIVKYHVIEKNKKSVSYTVKVRGEFETRSFPFVPRINEINIRGIKLVYVPKWDLEYEAGQSSFSRRLLGSSGRPIEDSIAKCRKCTILKMDTVAVCEVCGLPLCEKHSFQEGRFLCIDHVSDELRQKIKDKSIFSKFKKVLG